MAWIAYLRLFRFPLIFTAMADSVAGYLVARRAAGTAAEGTAVAMLAVASGGLYAFGMAMNDMADRGRDRTLHPDRVLPSGCLSMRQAAAAALGALAASAAALILVPHASVVRLGMWGAIVFLILAYDFFIKWPPVMGMIRAFNFLLGVSAAPLSRSPGAGLLHYAAAAWVYGTALTYVSMLEEGRIRRRALFLGTLGMALGAAWPSIVGPVIFKVPPLGWIAAAPLMGWTAWRAHRARDRRSTMLLIRDGVGGILLLDASMLLSSGMPLEGAAVAAAAIPAALLVAGFKRLA